MNAPMGSQRPTAPTDDAAAQEQVARKTDAAAAGLRGAAAKKDDAAMVTFLSEIVRAPSYLQATFREMAADRSYVYRDCMLTDSQDTVAVNQVLRNQLISLAYLGVSEPQPFCQPARRVGHATPLMLELFAQTTEVHIENVVRLMDFARKLEGAAQDASTNSYAVFKVTLQDDFMNDPIGRARFGDMQEQVAEYTRLKTACDAGYIQEGTDDWQKYQDLENTLKVFAAGKIEEQIKAVPMLVPQEQPVLGPTGTPILNPTTLQPITQTVMVPDPQDPREMQRKAILDGTEEINILGLPQLPHYQGFVCDQILPEDFRWDWRLTRPEDWMEAEWIAHRVFMAPTDIEAKWKVSEDEMKLAARPVSTGNKGPAASNSTAQDPNLRLDIETSAVNDTIAVWEVWHKKLFRRYVFIEGIPRLLENEVPQAVGARFYPFFPVYFNRVSGRVTPLSDIALTRNLQDEINMLRTHDREARRASYPVLFIPKGLMEPQAIAQYRNRMPFSVIEVTRPEEIQKYLSESVTVPYNPTLYSIDGPQNQLQQMFGLPMVVTGGNSGEDLASALALAKEGMETGVGQRRIRINRIITDVFRWITEISLKVYPESYMKQTCGEEALWPRMTTAELYTNLKIDVKGGLNGAPRSKDRLDLWMNFSQIAQTLGLPVNGTEVLRELLDAMGLRVDFTRFIMPVQVPGTVGGPGATGVPPAGAPAGSPQPSRGAGPDGGAPDMGSAQRPAPSSLEQVPNHPPIGAPPPGMSP